MTVPFVHPGPLMYSETFLRPEPLLYIHRRATAHGASA